MPFYKKKRRKVGPSKNDQKVQRAAAAEAEERAAGTLASRFPSVRALKVTLSIATPQGAVLETSEETFAPDDAFVIGADCPGSCGSGSYDFSPLLAAAITGGQSVGSIQLICAETSYGGGPGGTCGCTAKCDFVAS